MVLVSTLAPSAPLQVVQDRLAYHLKNGFGENHLFKKKWEDVEIYCKTGFQVAVYNFSVARSGQAVSFVVGITAFICSIIQSPAVINTALHAILHFIISYGIYSAYRWAYGIGVHPNVGKDADEGLAEEESSCCYGNTVGSKFRSALLPEMYRLECLGGSNLVALLLRIAVDYRVHQFSTCLDGSDRLAFFVPIDSAAKEN